MHRNRSISLGAVLIGAVLVISATAVVQPEATLASPRGPLASRPCETSITLSFDDSSTNDVRSDGVGSYFDGVGHIGSDMACDGDYYFLTGDRKLYFNLAGIGTPVLAGGNFVVEVGVPDGLRGIGNGQTVQTSKVQFNFVVGSTRYFLSFWKSRFPDTHDINVTRSADGNSWVVEATSSAIANLRKCSANGKCTQVDVGNEPAPLRMILNVQ